MPSGFDPSTFLETLGAINTLVGVSLVLLVLICFVLSREIRRLRLAIAELRASHDALRSEFEGVQQQHTEQYRMSIDAAYGVGRRLADTEKRVRETVERQSQLENLQTAEVASRGAQRLRERAGPSESLTRSEAKLAAMLKPSGDD